MMHISFRFEPNDVILHAGDSTTRPQKMKLLVGLHKLSAFVKSLFSRLKTFPFKPFCPP